MLKFEAAVSPPQQENVLQEMHCVVHFQPNLGYSKHFALPAGDRAFMMTLRDSLVCRSLLLTLLYLFDLTLSQTSFLHD